MKLKLSVFLLFSLSLVFAGNEDRVGSAGASQLLVNPWSRSAACGDAGIANVNGLEATFMNVAGLAYTDKTQIKFNSTNWLGSANIRFISAGLAQKISETSTIALSVQSMNFGDVMITTVDNPDGGIGIFTPRYSIFNLAYAKKFTHTISGGINLKIVSEAISNLKSTGVAIDAGIRYEKDNLKMGITLKNIGAPISYKGDGLSYQVKYESNTSGLSYSLNQRSQVFELPSLLSFGFSYDFILAKNSKLTSIGAYTANSFSKDQYRVGVDYAYTAENFGFNLRSGYVYEKDVFNSDNRTSALTGYTAGFSVDAYLGKSKTALGFEYAARLSSPFGIIHTFGTTISLK